MKAVICKPEDGAELLKELELSKFLERHRVGENELVRIDDIHRTFHFYVCRWLQEHASR